MKIPPGLEFLLTDDKIFRITAPSRPGNKVEIFTNYLELGVMWVPDDKVPGVYQKRVPTDYCLRLARGILNYWEESNGTKGIPGHN